jgi:hypothetical protein
MGKESYRQIQEAPARRRAAGGGGALHIERARTGVAMSCHVAKTARIRQMVEYMCTDEPPSTPFSQSNRFRVGKDSRGRWVVQDQRGLRGGIFVDRVQALRFAMLESGNCPQAIIIVAGILELDFGRSCEPAPQAWPLRRVA